MRIRGVERTERFAARVIGAPSADLRIREGDVLIVQAHGTEFVRCIEDFELNVQPMQERHGEVMVRDVGIAEVLIPPESTTARRNRRSRG